MTTYRRERGFALLIVLWSVVLLTLLATGIAGAGRADVRLAANLRGAAVAETAADGAVFAAAFHLLDPATRWAADNRPRELQVPGARIVLRIENEAGKINPNTAAPELLQALLVQAGADSQAATRMADAIADWRFPAAAPRPNGAKAPQYRQAGLEYGPPDAPFESLTELRLVLGMTPALLARLLPSLTVLTDAEPDPLVAGAAVLRAIRLATGVEPPRSGQSPPPRTVTVTAAATTEGGSRFVRRAAIRLGTTPREPLAGILAWETLDALDEASE